MNKEIPLVRKEEETAEIQSTQQYVSLGVLEIFSVRAEVFSISKLLL